MKKWQPYLLLLMLACGKPVLAQHSVTVKVYNDDSRQRLPAITILFLPEKITAISDSTGTARFTRLTSGEHRLLVTAAGFRDLEASVMLTAPDTSLEIALDPLVETMQDVVISSTRSNRLLKNTPVTVQVVGREDIEEGTAESPSNVRELLTELSGTQVQQTSAVSGNVAIRLQGLDGRYTQLLKDGFPLYGGLSGSLSILQVPPLDLKQVEVIKGAGSAFYGGDAIAGIINLISRAPDTILHLDAIVNQTDRGETDLGGYYSHRNRHAGFTLTASGSRQTGWDVNHDGFTDLPKVRQGSIAPNFFWYPGDSTTVRLGFNLFTEDREGGDAAAVQHGTDSLHPFLQTNHSDRDYYQLSLLHKMRGGQNFTVRNSVAYFYRSIRQRSGGVGPGSIVTTGFGGSEISSFSEASYTLSRGQHQLVTGVGLVTDRFLPDRQHAALGYDHVTPGVFLQDDWSLAKSCTIEAGVRADHENALYLLPRLALLYRPVDRLAIRLGGGLAYKLPTVFDAADEEDDYQQVYPIASAVQAERSSSANLSFNYRGWIGDDIGFKVDQNFYYTRLVHALIEQPDSLARGLIYFINAPGLVDSRGSETVAEISMDDLTLHVGYTYSDTRRVYLPGEPPLPLAPRSRLVGTLSYQAEPHWKLAAEGFYTGVQTMDDGASTRSFWTFDFSAARTWGRCTLLFNIEDLADTRQSKFGPLYSGTRQDPVFGEVYAPLDGRVISVAFKYSR